MEGRYRLDIEEFGKMLRKVPFEAPLLKYREGVDVVRFVETRDGEETGRWLIAHAPTVEHPEGIGWPPYVCTNDCEITQ